MKSSTIFWGIILVVAGGLLIADNVKLIDFDFGTWWPMILVIYGMYLVVRSSAVDPEDRSDLKKREVTP